MANLTNDSEERIICPYCDDKDIVNKGYALYKNGPYSRWECNGCSISFQTIGNNAEYLSTKDKFLTIDEFKIWGKKYYKDKSESEMTSLRHKIIKYQQLTNNSEYNEVLEAINKVKSKKV